MFFFLPSDEDLSAGTPGAQSGDAPRRPLGGLRRLVAMAASFREHRPDSIVRWLGVILCKSGLAAAGTPELWEFVVSTLGVMRLLQGRGTLIEELFKGGPPA
jgi:hypothetical protein